MSSRQRWLPFVRAAIDAASVVAAVLIAYNYRFHLDRIPIPGTEPPAFGPYLAAAPVLVAIVLLTFTFSGIYRIRRGGPFLDELFAIIGASVVSGLVALAVMSLYRG